MPDFQIPMAANSRSETPPPTTQNPREPPSLPTSPLAKRPKVSAAEPLAMATSQTQPYPPGLALALDHEAQQSTLDAPASSIPLQVKLHNPAAKAPTRGSKFAAGYDIYVCEDSVVPKWGKAMLSTGISIAIPPGTCMSSGAKAFTSTRNIPLLLRHPRKLFCCGSLRRESLTWHS